MIDRISTHILDTTRGVPAAGVPGRLERRADDGTWLPAGDGITDADGRIGRLNEEPVAPGEFRVTLDTEGHLAAGAFYPAITLTIRLDGARTHYHLPVLAGTYTYSTYLGS
ncbi:hydroxyisourate hydrolase [Nakamurella deserti]|uniref:hydroxyisourate hydrolase n=1 Tax=Nakamurella deserti TaxID=2164074 RepID=UPI000DBE8144|nr:hydroxyisourate hydrolase [Nakamurella deserti]